MKKYSKYILKDIGKLLPKLLAITLIVSLGVGFTLGLITSAPNMRYSVERFYDETNVADIIAIGAPFDSEFVEEVRENELIKDVFAYYSFDDDVEFRNGMHLAKINVIDFNNKMSVNKLTLIEGRLPDPDADEIEIVIERKQPFFIDVPLNYETTFMDKKVRVVGIVHNPWYFAFVEEISESKQRPIEVIIYADQGLLNNEVYTNLAITLNDVDKLDRFRDLYKDTITEKIDLLKLDFSNLYYINLNMNQSFAKYSSDVKIVEAIALIFPLFFLLITILVSMASITRIVEDQRNQIGILRSLGYGKLKILGKYILYALISSGIGAVLGIALGVYFIPAVVYNAYETIYNLPEFSIQYYFSYTSIISFIMIVAVTLVTIFTVNSRLREKPTELLRVKSPKPGKKIILEKIPFIWKKLKFKYKSTFRNIFRHKRNLILTLIGIAGSTSLLLAGFGIKDSVDKAGTYQFDEMMQYDLELNINNLEEIEDIKEFDKIYLFTTNAQYLNQDYITIQSFSNSNEINEFIKFKNTKGEAFMFDKNSVVITNQFAKKHNLKVGNKLYLKLMEIEFEFTITNIQEYYFGNHVYIAKELLDSKIEIQYNKLYVKSHISNNEKDDLRIKLKENEIVSKVMFEEDLKYAYLKTSESMNSVIIVLVFSACALAIIINYNLILINIHTRKREIATLKVLGYQEREVSGYVFRETFIISLFAISLGLALGKTLHYFIISRIVVDGILLFNGISLLSYIFTLVLSIIFLIIVYILSIPQTRRIDMIDALKSYE